MNRAFEIADFSRDWHFVLCGAKQSFEQTIRALQLVPINLQIRERRLKDLHLAVRDILRLLQFYRIVPPIMLRRQKVTFIQSVLIVFLTISNMANRVEQLSWRHILLHVDLEPIIIFKLWKHNIIKGILPIHHQLLRLLPFHLLHFLLQFLCMKVLLLTLLPPIRSKLFREQLSLLIFVVKFILLIITLVLVVVIPGLG